jgi:hypothetical protein
MAGMSFLRAGETPFWGTPLPEFFEFRQNFEYFFQKCGKTAVFETLLRLPFIILVNKVLKGCKKRVKN